MFIKINGKDVELKFGFKFVRVLDELSEKTEGVTPLDSAIMELASNNIMILPLLVKAGLSYLPELPDDEAIDDGLELMAEAQKGKSLCRAFIEAFEGHALHSVQTKKMVKVMEKLLKAQDQMMEGKMNDLLKETTEATTTKE